MNFLRPDSPFMRLVSRIADILLLHILTIICSIPIITIGAAMTANFSIAMKVVKDEDNGIIVPYFKAFKNNFKQATIVWVILCMAIFLVFIDWRWIILNGWGTTNIVYRIGVIVMSAIVWFIMLSIFPIIARYDMKIPEYFKAAIVFTFLKFIPLLLITIFIGGSVIACIWYARWLPLMYAFCVVAAMYFLCHVYIKQFNRLEKTRAEEAEKAKEAEEEAKEGEEGEAEETEETEEEQIPAAALDPSTGEISYAQQVKSLHKEMEDKSEREPEEEIKGNKFTKFLRKEKKKLSELTFKQKLVYLAQYYLPGFILIVIFGIGIAWFAYDVYSDHKIILTGGTINCTVSKEGLRYADEGFIEYMGYDPEKREARLSETNLNFSSDMEFEERYLDVALRAQMATGTFSYLIMRDDAVDNYAQEDYYQDLNMLTDLSLFEEDDIYHGAEDLPVGIKLKDDTVSKLGLPSDHDYYILFGVSTSKELKTQQSFIKYLYGFN